MSTKSLILSALTALIIIAMFLLGKSCGRPAAIPGLTDAKSLKKEIVTLKADEKITRKEIVRHDSIVYRDRHHYHEIRHDSLIPCPEKLAMSDTVIYQDSTLLDLMSVDISKLDKIIVLQDSVIRMDSLAIVGLKKEVKRQRRQKILVIGLTALVFGIAIVK